jgi:hypothetical protein
MFTDIFLFAWMNSAVRFHAKREATVYCYEFDYRGSNSFFSLFSNLAVKIGECLQFVEYVKHLQWFVRERYIFDTCTSANALT